ncbi:hypothetical protein AX14_004048 [Amanita brunnescens Koide BX004]|nr:hypothetical protein AX14_004048 [Amanita brunnescens Koide BX004]
MKLVNPSFLLTLGTALALVEAVPLRLLVVTNNPELAQDLRLGHAVSTVNTNDGAVPSLPFLAGPEGAQLETQPTRGPCIMRKMRDKAIEISNAFRTALGLPSIEAPKLETPKDVVGNHDDLFRILPFIGTPPTFVKVEGQDADGAVTGVAQGGESIRVVGPDHDGHHRPHHPHKHHKHHKHHGCGHRRAPFLKRLSFALMTLGPWEGRAVAFVLGCGLGVLLRMMWVLSVIAFRAIRGPREPTEYAIIHEFVEDDEVLTPAPPSYVYVDEKADVKKSTEESPAN